MTNKQFSHATSLFQTVVRGGYCIGCGACAAIPNTPVAMKLNEFGIYQATTNLEIISDALDKKLQSVCPFSDKSLNEDILGKQLYENVATYHPDLGYLRSTYAGYVSEGEYRAKGSSGGMVTWILVSLFQRNLIDGVIHVKKCIPTDKDSRIFRYQLSVTKDEIIKGAKTRYYPIEISEVIKIIRERPGRYAIIGVPCFIKAIRLMSLNDELIRERIRYCVGMVCAHLKSTRFGEFFAWQSGIKPSDICSIDFRTKLNGYRANDYGVTVSGTIDGREVTKRTPPISKMYGTNWGYGFFKYKACDYCDDVVAETADITIGDAWLSKYLHDFNGTNIIIVRHPLIEEIIEIGIQHNKLAIEKIDANKVVESQSAAFAHRRSGLAYRLWLADEEGLWRPTKRVYPDENGVTETIKQRQRLRIQISEKSHIEFNKALESDDFSIFIKAMEPLIEMYQMLYHIPLWRRLLTRLNILYIKMFRHY